MIVADSSDIRMKISNINKEVNRLLLEERDIKKDLYEYETNSKVNFCPSCMGSGMVSVDNSLRRMQWGTHIKCFRCNGSGYVKREES